MDGKRDTRSLESNSLKDHETKEGDMFDDPRLDKLWNKVCVQIIYTTLYLFFKLFQKCISEQ